MKHAERKDKRSWGARCTWKKVVDDSNLIIACGTYHVVNNIFLHHCPLILSFTFSLFLQAQIIIFPFSGVHFFIVLSSIFISPAISLLSLMLNLDISTWSYFLNRSCHLCLYRRRHFHCRFNSVILPYLTIFNELRFWICDFFYFIELNLKLWI